MPATMSYLSVISKSLTNMITAVEGQPVPFVRNCALAFAMNSRTSGLSCSSRDEFVLPSSESAEMPRKLLGASESHRELQEEEGNDDDMNSKRVARGEAEAGREAYKEEVGARFFGRFRCRGEQDLESELR